MVLEVASVMNGQVQANDRELGVALSSARRRSSPRLQAAVMLSSRPPSDRRVACLFPDDEHAYEPRRHVRFASLDRNALPTAPSPVQSRRPRDSPLKSKAPTRSSKPLQPPLSTTVQALRKQLHRHKQPQEEQDNQPAQAQAANRCAGEEDKEDMASRELWGFSVRYSPMKQLKTEWLAVAEHNQRTIRANTEQQTRRQHAKTNSEQQSSKHQADYAHYLYLASKYGPLDALFYSCCPSGSHGCVYALVVDVSARRIQRWTPGRLTTLRRYWVGYLAREVSTASLTEALESVSRSFQQQRQAVALLQRLRLLRAARSLQSWRVYTMHMHQHREKIRSALARDLKARFQQWRERITARKNLKLQLKHVARRKALRYTFEKWQFWREQQTKVRCHLTQRWSQTQRTCWSTWRSFVRSNQAATAVQREWRRHHRLQRRERSVQVIERVYRGYRARQSVRTLRETMAIYGTMLRLSNAVAWEVRRDLLTRQRALLLESELSRSRREAECVVRAEAQAEVHVVSEVRKVLRNAMHRKLNEHVGLLKQEDTTLRLVAAKSSSALKEEATKRLIAEQRGLARSEAIATFRAVDPVQNASNTKGCLICQANEDCSRSELDEEFRLASCHSCLRSIGVGTDASADAIKEVETWGTTARSEVMRLEQWEREQTTVLLDVEPSISETWRAISWA